MAGEGLGILSDYLKGNLSLPRTANKLNFIVALSITDRYRSLMPIVNIEITPEDAVRLDAIADREKRARRNQAAIMLMDRVTEVETEKLAGQQIVTTPPAAP